MCKHSLLHQLGLLSECECVCVRLNVRLEWQGSLIDPSDVVVNAIQTPTTLKLLKLQETAGSINQTCAEH